MRRQMPSRVVAVVVGSLCLTASNATLASPFDIFPIAATPRHEYSPKTDGRYVVWTEGAGINPDLTNDCYAYDLLLNQRITLADGPRYQDQPSISAGVAIWTDWIPGSAVSPDIYGRNLSGGAAFSVTTAPRAQSAHEMSGDVVVWRDERNGPPQIWGRRLSGPVGSDFAISSTTSTYFEIYPDVSGSVVVWMSYEEPGDQGNIYGRDLNSGSIFPISTNAAYQFYPKISGRNVVWNDRRDGLIRIYGKNLDSGEEFPVSSGVGEQLQVSIDGDLVVWRDDRSGGPDIWGRYLSGGPEFQITDTPDVWEENPNVSGNLVVWEQISPGTYDIYGTIVPEPCIAWCGLALLLTRRRSRPPHSASGRD